jgi:hypothetical protein
VATIRERVVNGMNARPTSATALPAVPEATGE